MKPIAKIITGACLLLGANSLSLAGGGGVMQRPNRFSLLQLRALFDLVDEQQRTPIIRRLAGHEVLGKAPIMYTTVAARMDQRYTPIQEQG